MLDCLVSLSNLFSFRSSSLACLSVHPSTHADKYRPNTKEVYYPSLELAMLPWHGEPLPPSPGQQALGDAGNFPPLDEDLESMSVAIS